MELLWAADAPNATPRLNSRLETGGADVSVYCRQDSTFLPRLTAIRSLTNSALPKRPLMLVVIEAGR